ncbi:hypothetical protein KS4_04290 [Poriferisphaera corsica]|uniref:Uncharacterized protein n=1 Tax=Poriferisphaera corsica TaxID=2528020 RepID=A0A517YQA4_9BACT|nr:hypothetical protein KS4_04290 [Poriferisphaera corsica]
MFANTVDLCPKHPATSGGRLEGSTSDSMWCVLVIAVMRVIVAGTDGEVGAGGGGEVLGDDLGGVVLRGGGFDLDVTSEEAVECALAEATNEDEVDVERGDPGGEAGAAVDGAGEGFGVGDGVVVVDGVDGECVRFAEVPGEDVVFEWDGDAHVEAPKKKAAGWPRDRRFRRLGGSD